MAFIDEIIGENALRSIDVEAFGGRTIYFRTFTLADGDYANKMSKGNDGEYVVYTLIRKCLDAEGNRLFTVADKHKLMNSFSADVLSDIVVRMKSLDEVTESEAEKN